MNSIRDTPVSQSDLTEALLEKQGKAQGTIELTNLESEEMQPCAKDQELIQEETVISKSQKTYCGITLRKDATLSGLLVIPGLNFTCLTGGFFTSAWIVFLVQDENLFTINPDNLGSIVSNTLLVQLVVQTISALFIGIIYDLIGRKVTIAISFVVLCGALVLIPLTPPSILGLMMARGLLGLGMQLMIGNPLINDYVVMETRGKATILQNLGYYAGEMFSMAVLFNFTKNMQPLISFSIAAVTIFAFGLLFILMTKELKPDIRTDAHSIPGRASYRESEEIRFNSKWEELSFLLKEVTEAIKENPYNYTISFFGSFQCKVIQVITVVCLVLWVNSFVETGVLEDAAEAKATYQNLILVSAGSALFITPIIIYTSDKYNLGWQIALIFICRAFCFIFGWPYINSPKSVAAYVNGAFMLFLTGGSWSLVEAFFNKHIPNNCAGSLKGIFNMSGQLGVLIFTALTGIMYDKFGPNTPFFLVGSLDLILGLLTMLFFCMGKLKY